MTQRKKLLMEVAQECAPEPEKKQSLTKDETLEWIETIKAEMSLLAKDIDKLRGELEPLTQRYLGLLNKKIELEQRIFPKEKIIRLQPKKSEIKALDRELKELIAGLTPEERKLAKERGLI